MEASKFYKRLAIIYFVTVTVLLILIWESGIPWDIIEYLTDTYYVMWDAQWIYYPLMFLVVFVKASLIYHKGLLLETKNDKR